MEKGILIAIAVIAIASSLWFRNRPMKNGQRKVAVIVAAVLMCFAFLRDGERSAGTIAMLVCGLAVLGVALRYLQNQEQPPE